MTPAQAGRRTRARRPGGRSRGLAAGAALAVLAVLAGACTISSESPDAVSLRSRSGPSSGTTTTSVPGDEAAPPDEPGESPATGDEGNQDEGAQDEGAETATGGDGVASPGTPAAGTGGDDAVGAGPDVAATADEGAGGQPADATGEPGSAAAPTAAPTPDTAAENGDSEPEADAGTAPDTGADTTGTASTAGGAFDERSKVSTVGIDAVYFGMTPEEAAERAGAVWAGVPAGGADCYVVTPADGPPGVALWVYHGTVERVDIDTPLLRTQSGLGVGTHLGELRSRLGEKLVVEDHPYLPGWTLATFVPTDPNDAAFRIAFDVSGGEVIRFRAGRTQIVALESCA